MTPSVNTEQTGLTSHTNGPQSFYTLYANIQRCGKKKSRPPKEEMNKSDLRSRNRRTMHDVEEEKVNIEDKIAGLPVSVSIVQKSL
jgi:hypothetical protein